MTCCNLESYLGAFKNNISQIQNIPSLTGGDNSEGKIIDDILKRNSETAETKQKNFINSSKEFLSRAQNSFDSLINHENSDKIELVNQNIPILYSKIEQINEVLEKQNKEIMKIFKKDDNNKNSEDIINLKILNKYLQETINKNNEKINYLQRENQKYKSKYFEMKKNYDTLLEEHIKMKNDLKLNNLKEVNTNNDQLKEINNNKQNFENLKDMQQLIKENNDLKKENWKLKQDIINYNEIIQTIENDKENLKLLIKGSYSEVNKSIFNSYNNFYNIQEVNNLFSSQDKKNLLVEYQKMIDNLN